MSLCTLISCGSKGTLDDPTPLASQPVRSIWSTRITVMADGYGATGDFRIVKVDDHEYLATYQGGVVHLESCPSINHLEHELRE